MRFKVIGWTDYEDEDYPEHEGDYAAVDAAVLSALREGGYRFDGTVHQYGSCGTPVLSDGTRVCYSMRTWGMVMAEALGLPDPYGSSYVKWMIDEEDLLREKSCFVLPPCGANKEDILPREALAEEFSMHLVPSAFEAVRAGKKRAELRLRDKERTAICKGDTILFSCGEESLRVRVTDAEDLPSFDALFSAKAYSEEELAHRRALVEDACFEGCETPEKLRAFLASVYPDPTPFPVLALRIELDGR